MHYGEYLFRKAKHSPWSRPASAAAGYVTANTVIALPVFSLL